MVGAGQQWGVITPAPGPCVASRAQAHPIKPLGLFRLGDGCVPGTVHWDMFFQGKVFPKLRKRSPQGSSESTSSDKEDDEATDYVFRIVYPSLQSEFGKLPGPGAPGNDPGIWNERQEV